jgi:hypothetical protein
MRGEKRGERGVPLSTRQQTISWMMRHRPRFDGFPFSRDDEKKGNVDVVVVGIID